MLGMSENSLRLHGAAVFPIEESEVNGIRPFMAALQQEGWVVDIDYEVDYSDASVFSKPCHYIIRCSQSDGRNVSFEVYKRPHSKGIFKLRFSYSIEVAETINRELVILGYVADKNHMEALRKALEVYLRQIEGHKTEIDALFTINPTESVLMGR